MAALLFSIALLLVSVVSEDISLLPFDTGSIFRHPRDISKPSSGSGSGTGAGSGAGAFSGASSSSFSSSSGTKVAPGPGGYGNFNAFAGNFGPPVYGGGGGQSNFRGGAAGGGFGPIGQPEQSPFGFPGFNPFIPQYGQQYPYTPFPAFAPQFDFNTFLNQYFQAMQNFQAQAQAHAQQAANSGHGVFNSGPGYSVWSYHYPRSPLFALFGGGMPFETNDVGGGGVGGFATGTYSPQGGYGSASVFPAPEGGLETRFGGEDGAGNSVGGTGPVSSVSGSFSPPGSSSYGVFTSSSSGSSDINGKKTSFKQSSIGINDNGKVTTYTAHDP